jgi:hypothetical protein
MRLKNKTWTNPQIKNHTKCHERISPQVTVKGFKKYSMSNAVGLMIMYHGITVNRMRMLGVSVRKMDTVTLIGKGRQNLTCFVH